MNRAERRRQQKVDRTLVGRGIDPERANAEHVASLIRELSRQINEAKRVGSVDPIVQHLLTQVDFSNRLGRDVETACRKGCWYCCTVWVAASTPEAVYFAKTMPKGFTPTYAEGLKATMAEVEGLDFEQRGEMVVACPALHDQLCSNYENRPVVCRTAVSADAEVCRRTYVENSGEDVPTPAFFTTIRGIYAMALSAACRHAGLDHRIYEMNAGVSRFLADPAAEQRWLAGESVFGGLPLDPVPPFDDEMANELIRSAFAGH